MSQTSMNTIIENAKKQGYAPLSYPAGGLIRRRCPECWTVGGVVIFRHQTDEDKADVIACECGYRLFL